MATVTKQEKQANKEQALEALRELLTREGISKNANGKPMVFTILRAVSRSGMSRVIEPVVIVDGIPYYLGRYTAWALDMPFRSTDTGSGVKVGGCGMDMGFHLVYSLAFTMYGDGYALHHRWM